MPCPAASSYPVVPLICPAKYKFFIPQELAYGANPRPGIIKPYMALIFEVELLEIK
jgi:hypothetical protein